MKYMNTERLSILPKSEDLGSIDKSEPILCLAHVKAFIFHKVVVSQFTRDLRRH